MNKNKINNIKLLNRGFSKPNTHTLSIFSKIKKRLIQNTLNVEKAPQLIHKIYTCIWAYDSLSL